MKIIHFSDTHLGFSDFGKIEPVSGINLREYDVYNAFSQIVDYIVSDPPDLVIHAGDLFDTYRPPNRAINFAIKEIAKIAQKKIPLVLISGNHSTPRVKSFGSIFEIFEIFPEVYPISKFSFNPILVKDAAVYCIPHLATQEELSVALKAIKPKKDVKYNILVTHCGVTAKEQFKMGEFNELIIPDSVLEEKKDFDYIALGHYHKPMRVTKNAYYSGSTERFSFNEAGYDKGFMEIDLSSKNFKFVPIKVRNTLVLSPIDCANLSPSEIMQHIQLLLKGKVKDMVVQLMLDNIHRHKHVALDWAYYKTLVAEAVHVKLVSNWAQEEGNVVAKTAIGTLSTEFDNFIGCQKIGNLDKEKLKQLGMRYLASALGLEE